MSCLTKCSVPVIVSIIATVTASVTVLVIMFAIDIDGFMHKDCHKRVNRYDEDKVACRSVWHKELD